LLLGPSFPPPLKPQKAKKSRILSNFMQYPTLTSVPGDSRAVRHAYIACIAGIETVRRKQRPWLAYLESPSDSPTHPHAIGKFVVRPSFFRC
jgi:hypothetical protein